VTLAWGKECDIDGNRGVDVRGVRERSSAPVQPRPNGEDTAVLDRLREGIELRVELELPGYGQAVLG
jgi:hypothetical protein